MVRIAVLGAGAWGLNHVRVVAADPRCELAGVADVDPAAEDRVRRISSNARFVSDSAQLLADPSVDAVIVATPAPTHAGLALAAFAANKHVMIEKPLAMNTRDALALCEASRASQRIGMVGHLMLYHPAVVRLRELLHSGALGTFHYLHSTRVNLGRIRHDENALWSFGPHDLSIIEFLLDRSPKSVVARGQSVLQQGVEDVVFLTLRYETGELAHVQLSWLSPRKERRMTLVCAKRMVEFDDMAVDKLRIFDKGYDRPPEFTEYAQYLTLRDGDVHIPEVSMREPLQLQLEEFIASIEGHRMPRSSLESGVHVTAVLEAAQRSLSLDGAPVDVEPTPF